MDLTRLLAFQASALVLLGSGPEPPEGDVFEAGQALVAKPSGTLMPCQCGRLLSQASGESINPAP